MKKFVSSLLIFSTLFSSFAPVYFCFAAGKGHCQRPVERYNVRRCSGPARPIDIKDEAALKQAILELAKDKKFTDQVLKNYEKAHEDPVVIKLLKMLSYILILPVKISYKIICKLLDYTIGHWVGEKICQFAKDCSILVLLGLLVHKYTTFSELEKSALEKMENYKKLLTEKIQPLIDKFSKENAKNV